MAVLFLLWEPGCRQDIYQVTENGVRRERGMKPGKKAVMAVP